MCKTLDAITTEMAEHICDNLCKWPYMVKLDPDRLENICADCKMDRYIIDICNHESKEDKKNMNETNLIKLKALAALTEALATDPNVKFSSEALGMISDGLYQIANDEDAE